MDLDTDKSSTFTLVAAVLAALIVASAAFMYVQSSNSGSADGNAGALAALSQAIPLHTKAALDGEADGLTQLSDDVNRLSALRQSSAKSLPGGMAAWEALAGHAQSIVAKRSDIEALTTAAALVQERMPRLLSASNGLLDRSGATATVQEFQRRGSSIAAALPQLAAATASGDADAAQAVATDMALMRMVTNALAGDSTSLDVPALNAATRETVLGPVGELAEIETQVAAAVAAAANLGDLGASINGVNTIAADLLSNAYGNSSGGSSGLMSNPYIPLGLLLAALLAVGVLIMLNAKAAVFERASRIQSEQNERNQQAILRLLDELGSLADGDLTVEATVTEDITGAIADSINYAIEKLRELVATINVTAIMLDSAAKQTENTAVHMARAADTQTKEISAATESIVSMAGSIEEVSGNAERSSDVARHSVEVAHKGGDAVRRTIDGMNAIRETIQETSKRIKRLGESSQEIGNIIELINDIAEQTNILALNASIQASMAGEAGRGFAVVADEVQRLLGSTTKPPKQIEVLVRTIQTDTNEAVVSMERSTTDVVGGALLAENAGAALDEIEQVSNQIANLVQNISVSARQQAGSAADVTRRTTKLKEISDQTGKATIATAASISKLSELASQLRQTVAGFTLPSAALQGSPLATASNNSPAANQQAQEKAAG
ncbi:MAG: methyl-accepting chemotaxis protein [Woeseiales bacterium]